MRKNIYFPVQTELRAKGQRDETLPSYSEIPAAISITQRSNRGVWGQQLRPSQRLESHQETRDDQTPGAGRGVAQAKAWVKNILVSGERMAETAAAGSPGPPTSKGGWSAQSQGL